MKKKPAVSVILPVFNGERYLARTVNSVLSQSLHDLELIIIDDGSTDKTHMQLKRIVESDNRVRYIGQSNQGITRALNTGIAYATSPYIARIDCGDYCLADRFSIQYNYLKENKNCVVVGSYMLRVTPEDWPIDTYRPPLKHQEIDDKHITGVSGGIAHISSMIRTSAVKAVNGYCEDFKVAQDYDLWLRLAEIGLLANIDKILVACRESIDGISTKKRSLQNRMTNEALKRAIERRGLPEIDRYPKWKVLNTEREIVFNWIKRSIVAQNYPTARRYAFRYLSKGFSFKVLKLMAYSAKQEILQNINTKHIIIRK